MGRLFLSGSLLGPCAVLLLRSLDDPEVCAAGGAAQVPAVHSGATTLSLGAGKHTPNMKRGNGSKLRTVYYMMLLPQDSLSVSFTPGLLAYCYRKSTGHLQRLQFVCNFPINLYDVLL